MGRKLNWTKDHYIGFAMGLILPLIGSFLFYTFGWGSPTQRAFKTALSSNLLQGMDRILAYAYFVKFEVVTNIITLLILNKMKKDRITNHLLLNIIKLMPNLIGIHNSGQ